MNEPAPIEIHKALADDTRYRLYRYLRLSGRPVPVRELATRLSLHANTIRPHLRRLVDAGLVASETRRGPSAVGRPQTVYTAVATSDRDGRDYRLLADILATLITGARARSGAQTLAREWGDYLVTRHAPPAGRTPPRAEPGGAARGAGGGRFRPALPAPGQPAPWRSHCGAAPSATCWRSTASWCAPSTAACSRGCWRAPVPRLHLRSFEPLADRSSVCRVVAGA